MERRRRRERQNVAATRGPGEIWAAARRGREEMMPHLLRLSFRSLSMAPGLIPRAKELIRGVRLREPAIAEDASTVYQWAGSATRAVALASDGPALVR
jgi:hypothetical protein